MKKPTCSVQFYKPETEKTEPNPNKKKLKKTESNQFELVFVLKNQIEPNQNRLVWIGFGFFLKKFGLVIFFYKNRIEPKIITPTSWCIFFKRKKREKKKERKVITCLKKKVQLLAPKDSKKDVQIKRKTNLEK